MSLFPPFFFFSSPYFLFFRFRLKNPQRSDELKLKVVGDIDSLLSFLFFSPPRPLIPLPPPTQQSDSSRLCAIRACSRGFLSFSLVFFFSPPPPFYASPVDFRCPRSSSVVKGFLSPLSLFFFTPPFPANG